MAKKYTSRLATTDFIMANTVIASKFGINESIILGEFLWLQKKHKQKNKLWYNKYFNETYDFITRDTYLTKKQIVSAITTLEKANIIETKLKYDKGKKYKLYYVNKKVVDDCLRDEDGSVCGSTLDKDAFVIYNRRLASVIGPSLAIVYADIEATYNNVLADGNLQEDGYFRGCVTSIAKRLGISREILYTKYIKQLIEFDLIAKKTQSFPRTVWFKINSDVIDSILSLPDVNTVTSQKVIKLDGVSQAEKVTRHIIEKAKTLSGIEWDFDFDKVNDIDKALTKGHTEKEFNDILIYMFNYYSEKGSLEKSFTFKNLFVDSKIDAWLRKINNDTTKKTTKENNKTQADIVTTELIKKANILLGKEKWTKTDNRVNIIMKRLEEGITEEELSILLQNRFDYLKNNNFGFSKFTLNSVFNEKALAAVKVIRGDYKNSSLKIAGSRDGLNGESYTREEIEAFKREAAEAEARGEQVYF